MREIAHRLLCSAGNAGGAFDGGAVEVSPAVELEPTAAFTMLLRARSTKPPGYSGEGSCLWAQWDRAAGKGRLVCYRNYGGAGQETRLVVGHSNSGGDVVSCSAYTNVGAWAEDVDHEVGFVFDGSGATNADRAKLYIDGIYVAQAHWGTWPAALSAPGVPLLLGARKGDMSVHRPWNGYLWRARLFAAALSAAQVAAACADPADPSLPQPAADWRFREPDGAFVSDVGGFVAAPIAVGAGRAPGRLVEPGWTSARKVLLIGDSLTRGYGALEVSGWRAAAARRLAIDHGLHVDFVGPLDGAADSPAGFVDVQHAAIDGRYVDNPASSADMLGDAPGWVAAHDPAAGVGWGGYNAIANGGVGSAVAAARLEALVRAVDAAKPGVPIVVCTHTPVGALHTATVAAYSAAIRALVPALVASGVDAHLADVESATSMADVIATDNVHLHRVGYQRAAVPISDAIAEALP